MPNPQPLLNSFKHTCFHSARCNIHQHPDLYRCVRGEAHAKLVNSDNQHVAGHSDGETRISAQAPATFPDGYIHPEDTIIPGVECPACNDLAEALSKDAAPCSVSVHIDMAKQAGLVDEKGSVSCPGCGGPTTLVPGQKIAEIHVKLCTDETIHNSTRRRSGEISEAEYQAWKASLTHDEKCGVYKRVPDVHLVASFTHDETALMGTDEFNVLMNTRIRERAELALMHQAPHRHTTTSVSVSL
jgi:hypothetical protein